MLKTQSDENLLINGSLPSSSSQIKLYSISGDSEYNQNNSKRRLSTFFGVVVPCCLSMFSVILFLRMGFIVGQAGLYQSIAMLFLAYSIILLTVLSVCAISTNGAIEGGGAYYMISRSLGPEFGGAIGLMFFLANVAATALYMFGMVEALTSYFGSGGLLIEDVLPDKHWWRFLYGSVILLICLVVCLVGAGIYAKTTFVIFLVVMVSIFSVLVSFFVTKPLNATCQDNSTVIVKYTGFNKSTWNSNLQDFWTEDYTTTPLPISQTFITVFAVLFNGCTGIMAGANMSGELKNPGRSIPIGTMSACFVTFLVYFVFILLITASTPRELLHCSYSFLLTINVWPPLVAIGVFFSSMSAGLSCLIGASRILYQLAQDNIFGVILNPVKWTTSSGNPIIAVLFSWLLVQLTLFVGGVSNIAPIVTIFYLISYAAVDLSCLALEWASAPNFRPTFHVFSWHTCVLGFISCLVMMFLIQPMYTSISFCILLALVALIHYRSPTSAWGYISQALIFHQVRKYMLMLDSRKEHVKFWRPQILLMVKNPRSCCQLIDFVNAIKKSGLYVLGHVSIGHLSDMKKDLLGQEQYNHWLDFVDLIGIKAFVELTLSSTVREGIEHLLRIAGLGGMKPNTLVLGFYDDSVQRDTFKDMDLLKKTVSLKRPNEEGNLTQTNNVSLFFTIKDQPSNRTSNFGVEEYVNVINDALKMNKNVCIARYFDQLDKTAMIKSKEVHFIDVWPIDLLKPLMICENYEHKDLSEVNQSYFDTTCIFLMQMACILNMSNSWKKFTQLRIHVVESKNHPCPTTAEIEQFIHAMRIKAVIKKISFTGIQHLDGSSNFIPASNKQLYLQSCNELIKSQLDNTAASFLYLPSPPNYQSQNGDYVEMLKTMTHELGPCILVHGLTHVITF